MIPEPTLSAMKILIVDDEPANVALLQYILHASGYDQLRATTDSREAMALYEEHRPDLILLDLMMPHLTGFDILEQLGRRVSREECLPVLVLTADATADTKYQALQAGASDFLTKPFDHVEALLRIRHLLQIRAQHGDLATQKNALEETVATRTSELRQTCRRLETTLAELRSTQQRMIQHERMSALGAMATGLAHDFNNSLSLILGYSELLQNDLLGTPYEARSNEFLGTVITAAQDAAKMFNRLRSFSRSTDTEDLHAGLDLNTLVDQAVTLTRPRWHSQALGAGAAIELRQELEASLPPLVADAAELREMLTNLIFNAVDAMPGGGTLSLRTRRGAGPEEALVLEVADTGVGMAEDVRRRCLEPFFTTKGERGTGLGLAMVYGTVQRHGGTIALHSAPGEGTCFALTLPLHQPEPTVEASDLPLTEQPARRILVVDDQPVLCEILVEYLTEEGHLVQSAFDGVEALRKFQSADGTGFELVITDKAMPGMGGEPLAAELKRLAPQTRIMLLTGYASLSEDGQPPANIDMVVDKPVTRDGLLQAMARVMNGVPGGVPAGGALFADRLEHSVN